MPIIIYLRLFDYINQLEWHKSPFFLQIRVEYYFLNNLRIKIGM